MDVPFLSRLFLARMVKASQKERRLVMTRPNDLPKEVQAAAIIAAAVIVSGDKEAAPPSMRMSIPTKTVVDTAIRILKEYADHDQDEMN